MDNPPRDPADPIEQLRRDRQALASFFEQHRDRLRRMVELRLDPRLRARLDASDVVRDAFLDVARPRRLPGRPQAPSVALAAAACRPAVDHVALPAPGHRAAGAGREISLFHGALPEASSAALASMLLGRHASPTQAAQRAERRLRVREALNSLDAIDREELALRHFEQLGRAEATLVPGISQDAGAKRYFRALKRLKDLPTTMPGDREEP